MPKSKIAKLIEILFKIILVGGIICLPFIPKLYDIIKINSIAISSFNSHPIYYRILFYLGYIICLGIIYTLNYLFKNIYTNSPFTKKIETSLKVIAILFTVLSLVILIKTIFMPTILSIAFIIVSFITSLCFYTLSQIFKTAIEYKNEIDYTI